jgi:hypothetical protein
MWRIGSTLLSAFGAQKGTYDANLVFLPSCNKKNQQLAEIHTPQPIPQGEE